MPALIFAKLMSSKCFIIMMNSGKSASCRCCIRKARTGDAGKPRVFLGSYTLNPEP